jgi:hypothetical protein
LKRRPHRPKQAADTGADPPLLDNESEMHGAAANVTVDILES